MSKIILLASLLVSLAASAEPHKSGGSHKQGFSTLMGSVDHRHYFHLVAANGEVILQSEAYSDEEGAKKGIEAARTAACGAGTFKISQSIDHHVYFVLKAENHEVVGVSQMYKSKQAAEKGIESVKTNACENKEKK